LAGVSAASSAQRRLVNAARRISARLRRGYRALPRGYSGLVPDSVNHLSCSFCGKTQKQVKKLIAGAAEMRAFICDGCVSRAYAVIAEPGRTASTPIATIQVANDVVGAGQCSFCGKRRDQVAATASAGDTRICDECLERCDGLLSEEPPVPLR
jgi:hypothetical protein